MGTPRNAALTRALCIKWCALEYRKAAPFIGVGSSLVVCHHVHVTGYHHEKPASRMLIEVQLIDEVPKLLSFSSDCCRLLLINLFGYWISSLPFSLGFPRPGVNQENACDLCIVVGLLQFLDNPIELFLTIIGIIIHERAGIYDDEFEVEPSHSGHLKRVILSIDASVILAGFRILRLTFIVSTCGAL